jgi:hypothetical protein
MKNYKHAYCPHIALATLIVVALPGTALAVDGQVLINQAKALRGGITPNDTPGFPVTISRSGSYKLSGNLALPDENTNAVEITAYDLDVTLDLNGFAILGPTFCGFFGGPCTRAGTGIGILVGTIGIPPSSHNVLNVTIENGTIRGMGKYAIYTPFPPGVVGLIDRVRTISNGEKGIQSFSFNITNVRESLNGGN